jgi:ACS family sodium-dependent inorganic phosphate cotransporter
MTFVSSSRPWFSAHHVVLGDASITKTAQPMYRHSFKAVSCPCRADWAIRASNGSRTNERLPRDVSDPVTYGDTYQFTGNIMPAKRKPPLLPLGGLDCVSSMKQFPSSVDVLTSADRERAVLEEYQRLVLDEEDALGHDVILLITMITAVSFVCSIDRAAMSVTILPMSEQFGWDSSVKGAVSSSFFAGYMLTNIFGGYLATRFSPQYVLAAGVLLWSLFTLDTPMAAEASADSLAPLLLVRAIMGIGEGVAYPSIQNIVRKSVPDQVRTRSLSFIYSGHQLGTIASYLSSPSIMSACGWPTVFWSFGSLGFLWLSAWVPLSYAACNRTGGSYDAGNKSGSPSLCLSPRKGSGAVDTEAGVEAIPWRKIVSSPAVWAIVAAQVTVGIGSGLSFSWLPTYFSSQFGVQSDEASYLCLIPFGVTVIATNCAGWIADGLVNNGRFTRTQTRKLMQGIASFGPAICLLSLSMGSGNGDDLQGAIVLVTAWLALGGFSAAGYGSNHQDLSKKYSGMLFGLSNGLASIAGSASIYGTGLILNSSNNDWSLIFQLAAGFYIAGCLAYIKWASCEEEF